MAAFSPDWQHDLFVSYGCVDDQRGDDDEKGWVTCFVDDLQKRLSEMLGRKDTFSVWRDEEELMRHVDVGKQIATAIEGSACMLVILSPGYLESDWCRRERNDFLKWVHHRHEDGSRVFIIERDWIPADRPPEFKNLLGFKFWTGEPSNQTRLTRPLDKNRPSERAEYDDQINRVTHAVVAELRRLKSAALKKSPTDPDRQPPPAPEPVRPIASALTVFLAEVTDDLRPQWKKVRTELDQRGVRVVSAGAVRDAAAMEAAVKDALRESQVFVQLLSQFPGQPLPGSQETYTLLQHRLALDSGKRILQWRSLLLTEKVFDEQEVEDKDLTEQHRKLVFGQVRAEHIEDFKQYLIKLATAPPRAEHTQTKGGMIFVNFNPKSSDKQYGDDLAGYLSQKGFPAVTPVEVENADPQEIRADFERNVLRSRAWIVVYGDQKCTFWVRRQLDEINQLLCENNKQIEPIHLFAGPPAPKDVSNPVGIHLPRLKVIDCQNGFEVDRLYEFLDAMTPKRADPSEAPVAN